ncbi:MAG: hypothetical protein AVDCRST_MAG52-1770 [uncultured Blastococcus sp.]|uniref:DUF3072 domain-containing protein n=1 Tax=uncultured Blastococcus sp. TaxID=217144 RepID=A0A6J4I6D3_9ACTN|nr:MAG: hypothetical protein AVDCRST_MAG52-1770 [uncultured Blastococcus sp.]
MSESNTSPDQTTQPAASAEKDPADWVTGDEPATGAQKSYLETLTRQSDEEVPEDLTKAAASQKIDELKNG